MRKVARMGMPAVALTDHGGMIGAVDFYEKANRAGIKPILTAAVHANHPVLEDLAENQKDKYATFWKEFGRALKEGVGVARVELTLDGDVPALVAGTAHDFQRMAYAITFDATRKLNQSQAKPVPPPGPAARLMAPPSPPLPR